MVVKLCIDLNIKNKYILRILTKKVSTSPIIELQDFQFMMQLGVHSQKVLWSVCIKFYQVLGLEDTD